MAGVGQLQRENILILMRLFDFQEYVYFKNIFDWHRSLRYLNSRNNIK
jgi:hypothetical protein